jgi:hypothetical protein
MTRIRLKHINGIIGRDGKVRYYFRKRGHKNVRLPDSPGSKAFMNAYAEAIGYAEPIAIGVKRVKAGTVAAIVDAYLRSTAFSNLASETQRTRRNIMEQFREAHGDKVDGVDRTQARSGHG